MPKTTKTKEYSNIKKRQLQKDTDKEIGASMGVGFFASSMTIIALLTLLSLLHFFNIDFLLSFTFIPGGIIGIFSTFAGPKLIHFFSEKRSNIFCVIVMSSGISFLYIVGLVILVLASPNTPK